MNCKTIPCWKSSTAHQKRYLPVSFNIYCTTVADNRVSSFLSSVQFSSVVADSWRLHGLQHTRPPCPSPTPGIYSNSCPLSQWCHPIISSSVVPFSSCPQSFPASGSFQMTQFFALDGQNIGVSVSASVLPMNIQDCSCLLLFHWTTLPFFSKLPIALNVMLSNKFNTQ